MTKSTLQEYLAILEPTSYPKAFKTAFKDFVDTYDGTETKELHTFLVSLMALLADMETDKVKAEAFDEIEKLDEKLTSNIKKLAEEAEEGKEGAFAPPVPA